MENVKKRVDNILSKLSLSQKIGQLNQMYFHPNKLNDIIEAVKKGEVGSVILCSTAFAGNDDERLDKNNPTDEIQKAAMESDTPIPILFGKDVIHGHNVVLPIPLALSCSFNFELIEQAYKMVAEEAAAYGVRHTYTPMLDLARDPRWGRVAEGTGEDPYIGAQMARAVVRGFQGNDETMQIAACAKHYIGYGASEGGRDYHKTEISDYSLRNYYLPAFRAAVDEGVATVMSSFNEINGEPVTGSRRYLTEFLRGELGFGGFVISDWEAVKELERHGVAEDDATAACLAINAGLDMDMISNCYIQNLEALVEAGRVTVETIDNAVRRILEVKMRLGLFEKPYRQIPVREDGELFDVNAHLEIARELSKECMVLLKNNDNILPLDRKAKYAAMGSHLHLKKCLLGTWSPDGDCDMVTTVAEALKNNGVEIVEDWQLVSGNTRLLKGYDTVIVALGEDQSMSGEGRSLANLELPVMQQELVKHLKRLGKKVIGVIFAGRPLTLESIERDLDAIIYAWHSGTETANALAQILFGDCSPSGRLTMTMPRVTGQVPIYYNYPPSGRACDEYYGIIHPGFNNYEDCDGSALYPFGFGLTYTKFEYSDIEIQKNVFTYAELKEGIKFSVSVKNIGNYDAKEVVQCYIRDVKSSMTRPIKELKATEKVLVKKGETKTVEFKLTDKELGFYNRDGEFCVEPGEFFIYVGEDCLTERKASVVIK